MRKIKKLEKKDFSSYAEISCNAYPGFEMKPDKVSEYLENSLKNPTLEYYGAFDNNQLLGAMRLHNFEMNFHGSFLKTGGVGFIAVDLLHKKKGVCKDLISYYLKHFRKKETSLAALYPFRPDFYKKMGFGYGSQNFLYKILPNAFPKNSRKHLSFLSEEDLPEIVNFYNKIFAKTHGYMKKSIFNFKNLFKSSNIKVVGYKDNNELKGYLIFSFKKAHENNFVMNDLILKEMLYENNQVLKEFCGFFNTQHDQIRRIVLNTQDEEFYHLLSDVRNDTDNIIPSVYHETNTAGMGLMYKIINFKLFIKKLEKHNFNNFNGIVKFSIKDSFRYDNYKDFIVKFEDGFPKLSKGKNFSYSLIANIDILSSLFMNSLSFQKAKNYGLVKTENNELENLFNFKYKPVCLTAF